MNAATGATRPFSGEKGRVAAIIVAYHAAARDGDLRRLCGETLSFGNPYGRARDRRQSRCVDSADLALEVGEVHRQPGSYGLQVRTIRIHASEATATVAVRERDKEHVESFFLEQRAGTWRVAARGLTLAHEGLRIYSDLGCRPRTISNVVVDMRAERAPSARAFLDAYLGRNRRPRPGSLVLAGVDYRESTRTFVYQGGGGRRLALFLVTGTNPYMIAHGFSFCRGSAGMYPDAAQPAVPA